MRPSRPLVARSRSGNTVRSHGNWAQAAGCHDAAVCLRLATRLPSMPSNRGTNRARPVVEHPGVVVGVIHPRKSPVSLADRTSQVEVGGMVRVESARRRVGTARGCGRVPSVSRETSAWRRLSRWSCSPLQEACAPTAHVGTRQGRARSSSQQGSGPWPPRCPRGRSGGAGRTSVRLPGRRPLRPPAQSVGGRTTRGRRPGDSQAATT